jgi:hypothetical protein
MENGRAARSERRNRNFGPDAKPARKRKNNFGSKGGEMGGKKGPLRIRSGGQFFGDPEEDDSYDDADLDLMDDFKDSDEEDAG